MNCEYINVQLLNDIMYTGLLLRTTLDVGPGNSETETPGYFAGKKTAYRLSHNSWISRLLFAHPCPLKKLVTALKQMTL